MITSSLVTYNQSLKDIEQLISCVLHSSIDLLFVIDNSPSNELSKITDYSPKVVYILNNKNIGFGAAHNIGINKALACGSKYHLIVNPDIYFASEVISRLYSFMEANIDVGLVMPKIVYPNGEIQYLCKLLPTPYDLILRRFIPFEAIVRKRNSLYELRIADYNKQMQVPSLSGCFMFIRATVFNEIGFFDERYFMYAEDVDLCRRIGEVYKTVYYPSVQVVHEYTKGSYKSLRLLLYHTRSIVKYFNKWGWIFDQKRKVINRRTVNQWFK